MKRDLPLSSLTFDPVQHEYRLDGAVLPGVTSLLDKLHSFAFVSYDVLEAAKERGGFVHLACQYHDEGDLDESTIRPEHQAYVKAWQRFVQDVEPEWSDIERPVVHMAMRYAGTPDRFGTIKLRGRRIRCQVDIKTSSTSHPCWGLQTMAYNHAAGRATDRRFTVQLKPDGTYRLLEWPDPTDWPAFCALVTLHYTVSRWKTQ